MTNLQKNQKVVLISLYERASLGVRAIFSSLKNENIDTSIISFKELVPNNTKPPTETEVENLIKLIKELNPAVVGISLRSSYFKTAIDLTRKIKKETDALIVWGGTHPTICPEACIQYTDIVCRGDGEQPMRDLIDKLTKGETIHKIDNLWVKTKYGVIKNKMRPLNQDLDRLPVYDEYNEYVIEGNTIHRGISIKGYSKYVIMATRGCPFKCTYCGNNTFNRMYSGNFVRRRSVSSVIRELEEAKKLFKNLRMIFFVDELFVTDKEWLKKFIEKYKKSINLPFEVELYPNYVKEDIITILKKGGLSNVTVGIQSGSQKILYDVYKRYTSRNLILNMHKIFLKYKIKVAYDIILDNPIENNDDKRETLNLLLEFKRPFILHIYSLTHFPKTELTELLLSKGMIKREDVEDKRTKTFTNWHLQFNKKTSTEDLFWGSLISLTPHRFMPKFVIRYMSNSYFLKKHPRPLISLAIIFRIIRIIELGTGMLMRGELNISTIKQRIKSIRGVT